MMKLRNSIVLIFVLFATQAFAQVQPGTGPLVLSPPAGTLTPGLVVKQTLPSSGSPVGPILGNTIDVINPGISASGSGWDAFGQQNLIYAQRVTMSITGATSGAGTSAFGAITNIAAASDGFGAATGVTITGASPVGHNAWGHIGYGIGFINSQIGVLIGSEGEVGVGTGGTVSNRIGVGANSQGPVKGSVLDAAFAASTITSHIPGSGTTSSPFEHLMALSGNLYGSSQFPITMTGDFLYSDIAGTVANGFNVANVIITGNALAFQNFTVTGAGKANFGNGIAPDATLTVNNNTAASTALALAVDAHLIAADNANGGVLSDVYGGETLFVGRASSGTQASKTARVSASPYMALVGRTYDGSAYASNFVFEALTVNLQSGTDHSSRARLALVPSGSTTLTDVMLWGPGVAIGNGATDPGAGNINLGGGKLQNNGTDPVGTGAYVRAASPALSGTISGTLTFSGPLTLSSALTYGGVTLSNAVSGTGNMALTAGTTFTGTTTVATLAATTINAFTLGGAISGGANQINNIVIGASTPLAGSFTTLTASTSISTPIYTSAGSHTFQSNGSTFAGLINTSQQWYLGTTSLTPASGSTLTVSQNTGGTPATSALGNIATHIIGADATISLAVQDTFAAQAFFAGRRAEGTQASKTALGGGNVIYSFGGQGWDGSAYATGAIIDFGASATLWSGTNHGGFFRVRTVTDGTTTITERFRVADNGGINIGGTVATLATSELGINKITASGSAPGAGTAKLAVVAGTTGGTCKLIMYAGTSTTATTVIDNVGAGC